MELIELVTPSGHKVYFKRNLNTAERRELVKIYGDYMTANPITKEVQTDIHVRAQFEAEEYAVRVMVKKVVEASGKEYTGLEAYNAIMAWETPDDGDAVFAKMNELTSTNQLPPEGSDAKKK
jgi:hypothetical protein